ncbi:uncharacterized protein SPAPADRAFT_71614 [Spathaspora passalidarum NRRL Y-27907]|uniref:RanBD1 domain-containing protein n=1 Tax=Spathaspora passalidarum (strain NRRL Y-27907 / 11-Y1) TaxID=619300 RepID=G3APE4_SPAPN|nr:uncharacterized protein SPAPADRAFT_71614 [Spathaspora passalidarum NRRL Y-27907]EGW32120.1 hypothetical protein SPAPADRAFT_71614 [Spathaspora passalidarum NRRL Y-27907]
MKIFFLPRLFICRLHPFFNYTNKSHDTPFSDVWEKEQITRDDFEKDHEAGDHDDIPTLAMKASDEVLATRKILKPKRRIDSSISNNIGFKGFGASAGNIPGNTFGFTKTDTTSSNDKNAKIRALNEQFVNAINQKNLPNSIVDYTPIAEKYIKYYKSITEGVSSVPAPKPQATADAPANPFAFKKTHTPVAGESSSLFSSQPKPTPSTAGQFTAPTTTSFQFEPKTETSKPFTFSAGASKPADATSVPKFVFPSKEPETKPQEPAPKKTSNEVIDIDSEPESDSDSEDDNMETSKPEIKVQGPQFTLSAKPSTKNSPFTFDPKKLAKINAPDSDDSDDEVVIKGPTFQFNKPIVDSVFKLGKSDNADKEKPAFSFGATANKEVAPSKPEPANDKPAFSFGSSAQKSDDKPAFTFGQTAEKKDDKPAFSFGQTAEKKDDKPAFAFGQTSEKKDDKPAFSFTPSEKKEDKPGLSFGSSQTTDKPSFSFKPNSEAKPFSFGSSAPAANDKPADKPAFLFGSTSAAPSETKDNKAAAFSFGSSSEAKPLFGSTTENKEEKPAAFSFGAKPAVSFGGEAPKFNFGGASSAFAKPTEDKQESSETTQKPLFNFAFNPSKNGSPFGGAAAAAAATTSSSAGTATEGGDDDKVPEEETGGDFTPVAQLSSEKMEHVSTGEEDEIALYTKRCKLMELDTSNTENPYINKGVGDLKVLKHKETQKSRILIRADGGLRVLLNTAIAKGIKYESMGNGSLVRIPTVDAAGKFVTFVVKVKTPADGSDLLKAITDVQ